MSVFRFYHHRSQSCQSLSMNRIGLAADRMLHAMGKAYARSIDDHTSKCRPKCQCCPCIITCLTLVEFHKILRNQRDRIETECIRQRLSHSCCISLHAMTQSIKANRSQNTLRHSLHKVRIHNGILGNNRRCTKRLLIAGLRVRKYRKTIGFRTGTTGRWN